MMLAAERRERIRQILMDADAPISASTLAAQLGVSRQIVVGDVALLRAGGFAVDATPKGYRIPMAQSGYTGLVACMHSTEEQLRQELYLVVDHGGVMQDVSVENPLYGELHANLNITSRRDADNFVAEVVRQPQSLLSSMTNGIHLHNIHCANETIFQEICSALDTAGILYRESV